MTRNGRWIATCAVIGAGATQACWTEDATTVEAPSVEPPAQVAALGRPPLGMVVDKMTNSATVFDSGTRAILGTVGALGGTGLLSGDCSVSGTKGFFVPGNSTVTVVDLSTSPPKLAGPPNPISAFNRGDDTALTADGKFLLVCGGNAARAVMVIEVATQQFIPGPVLVPDCTSVDVCSNGSVLVTVPGISSQVRRLRVDASGTLTDTGQSISVSDPKNVYCSPSGRTGIVISDSGNLVTSFIVSPLFRASSRRIDVASGAINHAGNRVYFFNGFGTVTGLSYDQTSGAFGANPLFEVTLAPPPLGTPFGVDMLAVHPSDASIYVSQPGSVQILDAATGAGAGSIVGPSLSRASGVCLGSFRPNQPPVVRCADRAVVADGTCRGQASINDGSFDPDAGDTIACTEVPSGGFDEGTTSVTLTCTDSAGESSSCVANVTVTDQTPPAVTCPAGQLVECDDGHGGATVSFTAAATDNCDGGQAVSCLPESGATFPLGTTISVCTASDRGGNASLCGLDITVADSVPPVIVTAAPGPLSPPDHTYRRIDLAGCIVSTTDACDGPLDIASHAKVIGCISDEPDTGPGDSTTNDCVVVDGDSVDLRAERADNGDGRVYTIFYTVTDGSGNAAVQRCTVEVPR